MKKNDIGCLSVGTGIIVFAIFLIALFSFINGAIIWGLWNWVIVSLFEAEPISYWLSVGIGLILSVIGSYFRSHTTVNK